jgi:hypothetical protein
MAYRFSNRRRGVGDAPPANPCDTRWAWAIPKCWAWLNPPSHDLAPPPAPTGDTLTVPPADEASAQATVDELLNQQMTDQQALAASRVQSSWFDQFASGAVAVGDNPIGGLSTMVWIGLGIGAFALVAFSGGSPRRYGR